MMLVAGAAYYQRVTGERGIRNLHDGMLKFACQQTALNNHAISSAWV
jgi:hypothetical protein